MNFTLTIEGQGVDALASLLGSFAGAGLTSKPAATEPQTVIVSVPVPAEEPKPTRKQKAQAVTTDAPAPADPVPAETAAPATAQASEVTVEMARAAAQKAAEAGHREKLPALIKSFGAENITKIPADKRAEFITQCEAL